MATAAGALRLFMKFQVRSQHLHIRNIRVTCRRIILMYQCQVQGADKQPEKLKSLQMNYGWISEVINLEIYPI